MKWEAFIIEVTRLIEEQIEADEKVKIQHVPKNNGILLTGVCIIKKGGRITPTIYLEDYYQNYLGGVALEEIVSSILSRHRSLQSVDGTDLDFFGDFEQVKRKIVFRLVNYERNKERLKEMPYMKYLDFAIVFYCHVSMDQESHASIPLYNKHMKMWNVDKKELWKLAKKNTPKLYPCQLIHMNQMVQEVIQQFDFEGEQEECNVSIPMYILTNEYRLNGAAVLLYKNVLEDFAKACKEDFYVLPSSIHEVIMVPVSCSSSFEEMTQMVQDVNATQVEPDEYLSNHAYYYSRTQQKLLLAKEKE